MCDGEDVLAALSLRHAAAGSRALRLVDTRTPPDDDHAAVLEAVDWTPTSLEAVVTRTAVAPARASAALAWLEREGWVRSTRGWWERC